MVAFDRNADKLNIARQYGADHAINDKGKSSIDIAKELNIILVRCEFYERSINSAGEAEMLPVDKEFCDAARSLVTRVREFEDIETRQDLEAFSAAVEP